MNNMGHIRYYNPDHFKPLTIVDIIEAAEKQGSIQYTELERIVNTPFNVGDWVICHKPYKQLIKGGIYCIIAIVPGLVTVAGHNYPCYSSIFTINTINAKIENIK